MARRRVAPGDEGSNESLETSGGKLTSLQEPLSELGSGDHMMFQAIPTHTRSPKMKRVLDRFHTINLQ